MSEVNRRANELNYQVQLYAFDLYQREYFDKKHFSGNDYYSELHRELHRIKKTMERWMDYCDCTDCNEAFFLQSRKEKIELKLSEMKLERQNERDSFVLEYVSK